VDVISKHSMSDRNFLLREFARDLCTCTEKELRERWNDKSRAALDKVQSKLFESRAKDHNPFYYVAQHVYFDNVRGDPEFLYVPLHRDRLCKFLQEYLLEDKWEHISGIQVLIQRDSFKSSFMHGVVPLTLSLRHKHLFNKAVRILLRHHKEEQASRNLQKLMAKMVYHDYLKHNWPEFCARITKDLGTQTDMTWPWVRKGDQSEVSITSAGIKASQTGFHQDYTFNDDLVTEEHVKSKTIRDQTKELYSHTRYTLDMKRGKEVNSGTRYHINDLWATQQKAKSMDGTPLYKLLRIKAIEDDGSLSFPTRHSRKVLEQRRQEEIARNGNDFLWWLQMQNEPKAEGLVATKPEWIQFCDAEDVNPRSFRIITIDPAWKGTDNWGEGDSAAIEAWALEKRGNLIILTGLEFCISNELTDEDGINELFRMAKDWGIMAFAPEERGGKSFGTRVTNEGITRGWPMQLIKLETQQMGKDQRIGTFLGAMQAKRVFFVKGCKDFDKFLDEYEDYPQIDHNDALDAAAYTCDPAITRAYTPRFNSKAYNFNRNALPVAKRTRHCVL